MCCSFTIVQGEFIWKELQCEFTQNRTKFIFILLLSSSEFFIFSFNPDIQLDIK